jgi:hypothetical protein
MRLTHSLLVFGICTLFLLSCSKNKEEETFHLSTGKVELWAGLDTVLVINTPSSTTNLSPAYTAVSANEQVASVVVQGNNLLIHTSQPGFTTIEVKGPDKKSRTISVNARSVIGIWRRVITPTEGIVMANDVDIQCSDPATATMLREQLLEKTIQSETIVEYVFWREANLIYQTRQIDKKTKEGTFSYSNFTLTLTENNTTEVFQVLPLNLRKIGLRQDLTERFRALYPDKGITRVVQTRYFNEAVQPG